MSLAVLLLIVVLQEPVPLSDAWTATWQEPAPIPAGWVWPISREEVTATDFGAVHVHTSGASVVAPPPGNSAMGNGDVEQWRSLVAAYWPAELVDWALQIIACESGGNPSAQNPSGASGLFQIMPFWTSVFPGDLFDPASNIQIGYQVYLEQGRSAWVCKA